MFRRTLIGLAFLAASLRTQAHEYVQDDQKRLAALTCEAKGRGEDIDYFSFASQFSYDGEPVIPRQVTVQQGEVPGYLPGSWALTIQGKSADIMYTRQDGQRIRMHCSEEEDTCRLGDGHTIGINTAVRFSRAVISPLCEAITRNRGNEGQEQQHHYLCDVARAR